jgi:hypothetical protein
MVIYPTGTSRTVRFQTPSFLEPGVPARGSLGSSLHLGPYGSGLRLGRPGVLLQGGLKFLRSLVGQAEGKSAALGTLKHRSRSPVGSS